MNLNQLRSKCYSIIDKTSDINELQKYYFALQMINENSEAGGAWDLLSDAQKEEILLGLEEIENPDNLISHEEMKKKYPQWFIR